MLTLDGARGEGGGQILRTALGLSTLTRTPFRITNIRAGREKPGLLRQHLTAVQAATQICSAITEGAAIGSTELLFRPGPVTPGEYRFAVGSAGSATLVLQTVLPALLRAPAPSKLTLEGGTHNPFAPPFDFLERAFAPLMRRLGVQLDLSLERHGFYPAGGGRLTAQITPGELKPFSLLERGALQARRAVATVAAVPGQVARRELDTLAERLEWGPETLQVRHLDRDEGPGNTLTAELEFEQVTELFIGFGEKGVTAERVAHGVAMQVESYLVSDAPVGEHLADQLILPLALAGGGTFRTVQPSEHTTTQVGTVRAFLDVPVQIEPESERAWRVVVGRK